MRLAAVLCCVAALVDGFTVRRTMTMKRRLLDEGKKKKNKPRKVTLTKVPGISAPPNGKMQAWSLDVGEGSVQFCAATLNERLFVLERDCGCCSWELDKGDLRGSAAGDPEIACCLCGQTYSLVDGTPGGVVQRKGANGFIGGLARRAPTTNAARTQFAVRADVKDGDVYLDLGSEVFAKAEGKAGMFVAADKLADK
jgi:hypothetical protein